MNFHQYTEREGAADRYEQLQSRMERFLPPVAKQVEPTPAGEDLAVLKETLVVIDECYAATGHIKVAKTSEQRSWEAAESRRKKGKA